MKKLLLSLLVISTIHLYSKAIDWDYKYTGFLSMHEPSYILFNPQLSKLQLSAKYRLFFQLYVSYTSVLFWDLLGVSEPVLEVSHSPSFFYEFKFFPNKIIDYIHIGLFEHKSNGKPAGEDDESFDRIFLRFNLKFPLGKYFEINFNQKYFILIDVFGDPSMFYGYLGWYLYTLSIDCNPPFKYFSNIGAYITFFNGGSAFISKERFSFELGAKAKFLIFKKINMYTYVQWYCGYGESIYNYNIKSNIVRYGLLFN